MFVHKIFSIIKHNLIFSLYKSWSSIIYSTYTTCVLLSHRFFVFVVFSWSLTLIDFNQYFSNNYDSCWKIGYFKHLEFRMKTFEHTHRIGSLFERRCQTVEWKKEANIKRKICTQCAQISINFWHAIIRQCYKYDDNQVAISNNFIYLDVPIWYLQFTSQAQNDWRKRQCENEQI